MTGQKLRHDEIWNGFGNQTVFGRHEQDEERGDNHDAQLNPEIVGLREDITGHQSQDQGNYLKSLHDEISARISELIEDKPKISMTLLLAAYLRPDPSTYNKSWQELHSWVTSMPQLLMASYIGLDYVVEHVLTMDPYCLSEIDKGGNTALHLASKLGFEDVVCTLLSAGVSGTENEFTFDYFDCIVRTQGHPQRNLNLSLFHAIERSHEAIVSHLLDRGADPNAFNNGNTPIFHHAIQHGEEPKNKFSYPRNSYVNLLLRYGADPEIQSKDHREESSLHVAVRWGKAKSNQMAVKIRSRSMSSGL